MSEEDRRKFTRLPFEVEVRVSAGEKVLVSHWLRDISLGGIFIGISETLPLHTPCMLDIDLIGPASLLRIQVEGEVVRTEFDGIAIGFTRIDIDSLIHLRHFIKVHASDPETVDEEYRKNLLQIP